MIGNDGKTKRDMKFRKGVSLYDALKKTLFDSKLASCDGTGICGACKVQLDEKTIEILNKTQPMQEDEDSLLSFIAGKSRTPL